MESPPHPRSRAGNFKLLPLKSASPSLFCPPTFERTKSIIPHMSIPNHDAHNAQKGMD